MIAATNMLRPPPAVIGSINKEMALPRTVKVSAVLSMGAFAILGFLTALIFLGAGIYALVYGVCGGAGVGWVLANYSPLQDESMATWLGLKASTARAGKVRVEGREARLFVGVAPLYRVAAGPVRLVPGAVPMPADRWDARGVPIPDPVSGALSADRLRRLPGNPLIAATAMSSQGKAPSAARSRRTRKPEARLR